MRIVTSSKAAIFALLGMLILGAGCGGASSAPAAPSGLRAEALSGGAHLTWTDNSDNETQFMIERKTGSGEFMVIANVPFNTTQYHDAPLAAGTSYTYRVMAMGSSGGHGSGAGAYSNEVNFTP